MTQTTDRPAAEPGARGRPRHHRHDLRLVLGPDREEARASSTASRPWSTSPPRRPPCATPRRSPSSSCSARCAPPATAPRSSTAAPHRARPARPARRATSTTRSPPRTPSSAARWSRPCSPCRSSCSRWCPASTSPTAPWVQLVLATPVVLWCAWPFHRAAAMNARHGASTMDTLVSLGVLAAYLWSASSCSPVALPA